jgi:Icc-related predicted phosphoesterase
MRYYRAFSLNPGRLAKAHWEAIPDDVDILITHGPPFGIRDENFRGQGCGDAELLYEVTNRCRPKFHIFGHIHECHGITKIGSTTFVNAASCNIKTQPVNQPIIFEYPIIPVLKNQRDS